MPRKKKLMFIVAMLSSFVFYIIIALSIISSNDNGMWLILLLAFLGVYESWIAYFRSTRLSISLSFIISIIMFVFFIIVVVYVIANNEVLTNSKIDPSFILVVFELIPMILIIILQIMYFFDDGSIEYYA